MNILANRQPIHTAINNTADQTQLSTAINTLANRKHIFTSVSVTAKRQPISTPVSIFANRQIVWILVSIIVNSQPVHIPVSITTKREPAAHCHGTSYAGRWKYSFYWLNRWGMTTALDWRAVGVYMNCIWHIYFIKEWIEREFSYILSFYALL